MKSMRNTKAVLRGKFILLSILLKFKKRKTHEFKM
jgi:hypothetical protein